MRRVVPAIARHMTDEWTSKIEEAAGTSYRATLKHLDQELVVQHDRQKSKLLIYGRFPLTPTGSPNFFDNNTKIQAGIHGNLEINVSAKRSPITIARDIENRLLPHYQKALKFAKDRNAEEQVRIDKRMALLKAVAAVFNEPAPPHPSMPYQERFGNYYRDHIQAEVQHVSVNVTICLEGSKSWIVEQLKELQKVAARRPKKPQPRKKKS